MPGILGNSYYYDTLVLRGYLEEHIKEEIDNKKQNFCNLENIGIVFLNQFQYD
jgi:hypothetical protein